MIPTPSWQSPTLSTVPVVGRLQGDGDALWRSDLCLTNRESVPVGLQLDYRDGSRGLIRRTVRLAAHATLLLTDIVDGTFGAADGKGPLSIHAVTAGVQAPAVTARIFTSAASGEIGQLMPAVDELRSGTWLAAGLRHDESVRCNVAVTAGADADVVATFALFRGAEGRVAGGVSRTVAAGAQAQWSLEDLFPGELQGGQPLTVRARLSAPGIAYASMVDNDSGDAVTVLGVSPANDWIVPALEHGVDEVGRSLTSDVALANVGRSEAVVDLTFVSEGGGVPGAMLSSFIELPPGTTVVLDDIVRESFGVGAARGFLNIRSTEPIVASGRGTVVGAGAPVTWHGVPAAPVDQLRSDRRTLPGVRVSGRFRSEFGVVTADRDAIVRMTLRDEAGGLVDERTVEVARQSSWQRPVVELFDLAPGEVPVGACSLLVEADSDIYPFLVTTDRGSGDRIVVSPQE